MYVKATPLSKDFGPTLFYEIRPNVRTLLGEDATIITLHSEWSVLDGADRR